MFHALGVPSPILTPPPPPHCSQHCSGPGFFWAAVAFSGGAPFRVIRLQRPLFCFSPPALCPAHPTFFPSLALSCSQDTLFSSHPWPCSAPSTPVPTHPHLSSLYVFPTHMSKFHLIPENSLLLIRLQTQSCTYLQHSLHLRQQT